MWENIGVGSGAADGQKKMTCTIIKEVPRKMLQRARDDVRHDADRANIMTNTKTTHGSDHRKHIMSKYA